MAETGFSWQETTLVLSGAVTIATVAGLARQLPAVLARQPGQGEAITLNCQGMDPADSSAIALLLEVHKAVVEKQQRLSIVGLKDQLQSLLAIYGVDEVLNT